jgi:tRNA/rRNA methyltransferase
MGENIGSAARAMWNFELQRMRLVTPRDGWPNPAAVATASGASRVLDHVRVFDSTAGALGDMDYVFATTARSRDLTKPVMTPERAMEHTRALIASGKQVGIMFGPERAGLENVDIAHANALISVPVNPGFASLNLAQCVLLVAYEWRRQTGEDVPEVVEMAGTEFASQVEVEKLFEHFVQRLDTAKFFYPDHKADSMRLNLRNMLSRLPMTQADIQTFHGMLRQFVRWKERGD